MQPIRSSLHLTASNSAWLFAVHAVRMLVGFSVGLLMMRHLQATRFGLLSEALALLALVAPLGDLGLTAFLRTELLKGEHASERLLATVIVLRTVGTATAYLLAVVLSWRSGTTLMQLTLAASLSLFTPVLLTPEQWFTSRLESHTPSIAQMASVLGAGLLRLLCIAIDAPLWAFALCTSAEALLVAVGMVAVIRKQAPFRRLRFDAALMRPALVSSLPLLVTVVALAWQTRVDQLLIGRMAGTESLGLYAAAVRLSELAQTAVAAVCLSLLPRFANRHKIAGAHDLRHLRELADTLVTISLVWAAACTATAWAWLPRLLGPTYAGTAGFLAVHAWTCVFQAMGFARSTLYTLDQRNHVTMVCTLVGCILATLANVLLIPRYGAWASAWVALLGTAITNWLTTALVPGGRTVFRVQAAALFAAPRVLALGRRLLAHK